MNLVNETFGSQMRNECNLFESLLPLSQTSMPVRAGVTFVIPIPLNVSLVRCSCRQITHMDLNWEQTHNQMGMKQYGIRCPVLILLMGNEGHSRQGFPLKCLFFFFFFHFDLQRRLWLWRRQEILPHLQ